MKRNIFKFACLLTPFVFNVSVVKAYSPPNLANVAYTGNPFAISPNYLVGQCTWYCYGSSSFTASYPNRAPMEYYSFSEFTRISMDYQRESDIHLSWLATNSSNYVCNFAGRSSSHGGRHHLYNSCDVQLGAEQPTYFKCADASIFWPLQPLCV